MTIDPKLPEKLKRIAGWLEPPHFGEDHDVRDALLEASAALDHLTARVAELERESATLSAGSCDVPGGKIGDEHGHFYCALQRQLAAKDAEIERLREVDRWASDKLVELTTKVVERDKAIAEAVSGSSFTYKARNGRDCYIEDDSGERCVLVPHDAWAQLQAFTTTPATESAPGCYCTDCIEGTPSARITGDKDRFTSRGRPTQDTESEPECPASHDGRHHVDTSMESGPYNCFHCERPM